MCNHTSLIRKEKLLSKISVNSYRKIGKSVTEIFDLYNPQP
jgi:hypothetical protein